MSEQNRRTYFRFAIAMLWALLLAFVVFTGGEHLHWRLYLFALACLIALVIIAVNWRTPTDYHTAMRRLIAEYSATAGAPAAPVATAPEVVNAVEPEPDTAAIVRTWDQDTMLQGLKLVPPLPPSRAVGRSAVAEVEKIPASRRGGRRRRRQRAPVAANDPVFDAELRGFIAASQTPPRPEEESGEIA